MAVAVLKQIALPDLENDAEREREEAEERAEIHAGFMWRTELWEVMRTFVASYVGKKGSRGYDAAAAELDKRWAPHGRPVAGSALRAALNDSERNNFRAEWLDWFAARSPEVARLMARRVKPQKTDAELLADLEAEVREELSHRRAEAVLRKARTR